MKTMMARAWSALCEDVRALWMLVPEEARHAMSRPMSLAAAALIAGLIVAPVAQSALPPQTSTSNPFRFLFSSEPLLTEVETRRFVRRADPAQRARVQAVVVEEAQRQGVDPVLAVAVAIQESGLRDAATVTGPPTRYGRAVGTLQVLPSTGRAEGCGNLRDTRENVRCGIRYLRQGLERCRGDMGCAARFYHGGPNTRIHGRQTAHYGRAVLSHYARMGGRGRHQAFFASSRGAGLAGDNSHFERMMIERHAAPN